MGCAMCSSEPPTYTDTACPFTDLLEQVRLVEASELRQAACSCMVCQVNTTATKQPGGANACLGKYLQFHKVLLAFRMLEGAERDGARFDAVLRIRMDIGFLVLPDLEAQLQHAASMTTVALLQRDAAWLASRRVATAVAVAWSTMGEQWTVSQSEYLSAPDPALVRTKVLRPLEMLDTLQCTAGWLLDNIGIFLVSAHHHGADTCATPWSPHTWV